MGQSVLRLATGWKVESRWGARFSGPVQTNFGGPIQLPIQWVAHLSPGQSCWGLPLTTHSHQSAEVKEIVKL